MLLVLRFDFCAVLALLVESWDSIAVPFFVTSEPLRRFAQRGGQRTCPVTSVLVVGSLVYGRTFVLRHAVPFRWSISLFSAPQSVC